MKKIIVAGVSLLMAWMIATPGFAIETKVTGTLTFDGILNVIDSQDVADEDETMAFREMKLEINTQSKINEKITLNARFDVLDKILNSPSGNYGDGTWGNEDDNIQVDRLWMDIITPVGLLTVGRVEYSKWGTDFYDDGSEGADRIKLVTPIPIGDDKLYLAAIAEKAHEEGDQGISNRDNDKFYLAATYAHEQLWRTGLLFGYYPYNSFINPDLDLDANFMYIAPYFSGKVGPMVVNAEFGMITGDYELKTASPLYSFYDSFGYSSKGDIDTMCYWLEVAYPMDKVNVELGYYYMSGDKTSVVAQAGSYATDAAAAATAYQTAYATTIAGGGTAADAQTAGLTAAAPYLATLQEYDDIENAGALAQGSDWEKVFILTADDHGIGGNILDTTSDMNAAGMSMMYIGANVDINEKFSVNGLFAMATADEVASGVDDDYGMEIDLGFSWKCMANLEYNAKAGYLMGGDWWKDTGNSADDLTITALYHELVLSF